jgi:sporulation integral membrane protein YlbJ
MKRALVKIGIVILFFFMLLFPKAVFRGASDGLLLWFQIVLPTLFPFILLSNLLLYTDSISYLCNAIGPTLCRLFRVSKNGSFAIVVGFLCGYPMGAKVTADLLENHYISEEEGNYLLSFCNNTSPIFILNFIVWKTLGRENLLLPSICILLGVPMLLSFVFRRVLLPKHFHPASVPSKPNKQARWNFSVMDTCIMNAAETIVKVGGYILLFSVLLALVQEFPVQPSFFAAILPTLEVTNGIVMLGREAIPLTIKYPAILGLTAFGGWCAVAQTQCMISKTSLSIGKYIIEKLVTALVTSLVAFAYIRIFYF